MHELTGGCHCGNISVVYHTRIAPEEAQPRACQCGFCRKHNTAAVSDNEGDLTIRVKDGEQLSRYQFGLKTCEFLICRNCGVYVAAFAGEPDDSAGYATLMSFCLDERARYPAAAPSDYAGEDAQGRRARRRRVWTPARLIVD
ncbi:MAG: aldehyde-activating protein [Alphaproteobacteria bacterium]|nr:MAG: aldehyde-activating protein [Alphaproteobacteria bacterium]